MSQTCLPDALWTDPRAVFLRKKRRRLWILLCDIERLSSRWHPDDVASWPDCVWAANLDVRSERQFEKDVSELREWGLLAEEAIKLQFCQEANTAAIMPTAQPSPAAPRPRYPSDEKRKIQSNGHSRQAGPASVTDSATAPQELRTDSAAEPSDTPQTLRNDSAGAPQETAQAQSLSLSLAELSQASLASDIYKKAQAKLASLAQLRAAGKLKYPRNRILPDSEEISELLGAGWHLEEIAQAVLHKLNSETFEGAGHWVKLLLKMLPEVRAQQQQAMTMLSSIAGGATGTPEAARQANETLRSAHWRPPPGVDPRKDVLAAARDAVRRSG